MIDESCMYCAENEHLQSLMIRVCELGGYRLYLFRDQTYPGRCILAFKDHKRKLADLTAEESAEFFARVHDVSRMLDEVFQPYQVNIAMFGDKVKHLHCHFVPKYEGGTDFGGMFQMNPVPEKMLSDKEYDAVCARIRAYFGV